MPPRLPLSSRASAARSYVEAYTCPSCTFRRSLAAVSTRSAAQSSRYARRRDEHTRPTLSSKSTVRRRHASTSTLASSTAINPPSNVPDQLRELHKRLQTLKDEAGSYVDLARIELALKSLESETPVTRVALLGLGSNGALAARKLARVLLGDALSDEEAWERQLLESAKDGRTLLLRYGDVEEVPQSSSLVLNMNVPSPFLRRHNVEILVSTINTAGGNVAPKDLESAILVPSMTTPAGGGRVGFVRYPVHKALIVAEGISGAIEWGRFPVEATKGPLVQPALSIPLHGHEGVPSLEEAARSNAVDIDLATHALQLFRSDSSKGVQFSQEWRTSRVAVVGDWIAGSKSCQGMKTTLKDYVYSVLDDLTYTIKRVELDVTTEVQQRSISESKRSLVQEEISKWAANAHEDLQMNLATALESKVWRRTAWFRLLWRIDDVSVSAADVLRSGWLTEAEQTLAWLSGSIVESGLATTAQLKEVADTPAEMESTMQVAQSIEEAQRENKDAAAEVAKSPSMISRINRQAGINRLFDPPWPHTIHLRRQNMLNTVVPDLHRTAQGLLVSTLSTIGGAAALSGWLYIATSGIALYESGAIAAFGLVWSLRRLQKQWSLHRDAFTSTLRENGRTVLSQVEGQLRKLTHDGGRVTVPPETAIQLQRAQRASVLCREALAQTK